MRVEFNDDPTTWWRKYVRCGETTLWSTLKWVGDVRDGKIVALPACEACQREADVPVEEMYGY